MEEHKDDYPKEPISGDNLYYCCSFCGISDPQINGRLSGHAPCCEWRIKEEAKEHKDVSGV